MIHKMELIIPHQSSREHYRARSCVVWCFDARFQGALLKVLDLFKISDPVVIAGGAKSLASPKSEKDRESLLGQILASIKLHHSPEVVLMVHDECGAYDGKTGADFYLDELKKAAAYLSGKLPADVKIRMFFVDFDNGVHEVKEA